MIREKYRSHYLSQYKLRDHSFFDDWTIDLKYTYLSNEYLIILFLSTLVAGRSNFEKNYNFREL